jgi:hypothetical protein
VALAEKTFDGFPVYGRHCADAQGRRDERSGNNLYPGARRLSWWLSPAVHDGKRDLAGLAVVIGIYALGCLYSGNMRLGSGFPFDDFRFPLRWSTRNDAAPCSYLHDGNRHRTVVRAHLSGQPLNGQLVERKAKLLETTPPDPAIASMRWPTVAIKTGSRLGTGAGGIEIEIWDMDEDTFGSFVAFPPRAEIRSADVGFRQRSACVEERQSPARSR